MSYKYMVYALGHGGEHTIGIIPHKVAEYWLDKENVELYLYMFSGYWDDDKEELNKTIPEEFQINEYWHDMDEIEHMFSVEFESSNVLIIEDAKTGETVAEINMTEDLMGDVHNPFAENNAWKGDNAVVYGQSFEKGGFNFMTLQTDEPFDASKVKFNVTEWSTLKLVNSVDYGGMILPAEDGDTIGKSMAFWIDD